MEGTKQRRHLSAADELGTYCPHLDAKRVVVSLSAGLTGIRNLLLARVHEDVERHYGIDSLSAPMSRREETRQLGNARTEIEIYSTIVVAEEVERGAYVDRPAEWFLDWLFHLRLEEEDRPLFKERADYYVSPSAEERRLKFLTCLQNAIPESAKTPLVLFRLFPRSLRIVAAVAFSDASRAAALREAQQSFLPAVSDCPQCAARVLDNDEVCLCCGNPVWKFAWLCAD